MSANTWKVISGIVVVGASYAASHLVKGTWKAVKPDDPPEHPRLPTAHLGTAVIVAGITGIVSTILKFVITRFLGDRWQKAGGELPDQH